jgi:hypothetical protein
MRQMKVKRPEIYHRIGLLVFIVITVFGLLSMIAIVVAMEKM